MKTNDKIRARRLELNLTLDQVAHAVGVAKSTVKKWESGQIASMRQSKIAALAEVLHVNPMWLVMDDPHEPMNIENIFPVATQKIPLLGKIACGKPIYAEEEHEVFIAAGKKINADFCLECRGDSMIGARIQDGDIVFIKRQDMVDNGQVAAVMIGDEVTLKRVFYYKDQQKLVLQAENPKYAPLVYVGAELDSIRILGLAYVFQSPVQ